MSGNFSALLGATLPDRAMMLYLDMEDSDKKQPIEDVQLLTQGEILCRKRCSGQDKAPDEQKESGDEDHKCEANCRK